MAGQGPRALLPLTGVRFVAAMHVVLLHFVEPLLGSDSGWIGRVIGRGFVGVELFFVLSGFVLAYVHEDVRDPPAFWQARFARVYPANFLAFVLYAPFALSTAAHHHMWRACALSGITAFFLVQSWYPWLSYGWNPPAWSLSVEAAFYALFPFVRARLGKIRALIPALLTTWFVALLVPTVYLRLDPDHTGRWADPAHTIWFDFFRVFPLFRVPDFVFGMFLGVAFLRHGRSLSPRVGAALSGTGAVAIVVVLAAMPETYPMFLHIGLLLPAFGLLLFGLAVGGGPLAAWLARPALVTLGEASYALYILQMPVAMAVQSASRRLSGRDLSDPRVAVAGIGLMLVASICAHRWFEVPARRLIRNWGDRARAPAEVRKVSG